MNKLFTCVFLLASILPAQQLAYSMILDTTVYYSGIKHCGDYYFIRSPGNYFNWYHTSKTEGHDLLLALQKNNSNICDIYSMNGKVGSFTLPPSPNNNIISNLYITQTFLDDDLGWELILNYDDTTTSPSSEKFKVIDDNGTVLLSDSGAVYPTFDGTSTYVLSFQSKGYYFRAWKFRSNIAFAEQLPLSKSGTFSAPSIVYTPQDKYRIKLTPILGGKTSLQFMDIMGRVLFSQILAEGNKPITIDVPSSHIPIISRTNNLNGTNIQKIMPFCK